MFQRSLTDAGITFTAGAKSEAGVHNLTAENDVQGLLAKSDTSFHSLILESTYETVGKLTTLAMKRFSARRPGSIMIESHAAGLDASQSGSNGLQLNGTWRIWWRKPDCWRDEYEFASGGSPVVSIASEAEATFYEPTFETLYTTRAPTERPEGLPSSVDVVQAEWGTIIARLQSIALFSDFGMSGWALDAIGKRTHCGRDAVIIRARRGAVEPEVWPWVDEYELIVDLERGVLLSCAGIVDGQHAVVMSVRSIEFDAAIPDTVFSFKPPAGTKIVWCRRSAA